MRSSLQVVAVGSSLGPATEQRHGAVVPLSFRSLLSPCTHPTPRPHGDGPNTPAPLLPHSSLHHTPPQASITREDFEALAADFFSRAAAPLRRVLERNGVKAEELDAVELLGGGSRVPRLQAALSEVLGGRGLDRWGGCGVGDQRVGLDRWGQLWGVDGCWWWW